MVGSGCRVHGFYNSDYDVARFSRHSLRDQMRLLSVILKAPMQLDGLSRKFRVLFDASLEVALASNASGYDGV